MHVHTVPQDAAVRIGCSTGARRPCEAVDGTGQEVHVLSCLAIFVLTPDASCEPLIVVLCQRSGHVVEGLAVHHGLVERRKRVRTGASSGATRGDGRESICLPGYRTSGGSGGPLRVQGREFPGHGATRMHRHSAQEMFMRWLLVSTDDYSGFLNSTFPLSMPNRVLGNVS